jgi:hypothetical protein
MITVFTYTCWQTHIIKIIYATRAASEMQVIQASHLKRIKHISATENTPNQIMFRALMHNQQIERQLYDRDMDS